MKKLKPHWLTAKEEKLLGSGVFPLKHKGNSSVVKFGSLYYFFDETKSSLFGPFIDVKNALESLERYTRYL